MKSLLCFLLLCILLPGCANSSSYPPSNYIGGNIGAIGKYPNGELPGTDLSYSGYWNSLDSNGTIRTEGFYKNGIPVGIWKTYNISGVITSLTIYLEDGRYRYIAYYPEGMIMSEENGTVLFANKKCTRDNVKRRMWSCDGDAFAIKAPSTDVKFKKGYHLLRSESNPVEQICNMNYSVQNVEITPYVLLASDNNFKIWLYMCSGKKGNVMGKVEKTSIEGSVDEATGECVISRMETFGSTKFILSKSEIIGNKLWLHFYTNGMPSPTNQVSLALNIIAVK